jgi:hypothetical protein
MGEQKETVVVYNHSEQKRCCGPLDLKIGANTVNKEDLEKAKKHPIFKTWKQSGIISFGENQDGVQIPNQTEDITTIPFNEAKTLVETTFDLAKLEAWKTQELNRKDPKKPEKPATRTTLIQAIDAQIEAEKSAKVGNVKDGKVTIDNPSGSGSEE